MKSSPSVTIWRNVVLPISETFIAAQAGALERWEPKFAGIRAAPHGLPVEPDLLVASDGRLSRHALHLFARTGFDPRLHVLLRRSGLVHAHFVPDAANVLRAARLARRPLVVTAHGYDVTSSVAPPWLRQEVFADASRLYAVSDFIAGRLVALGAAESKVAVMPIGISLPTLSPRPPTGSASVLFVGRLVEKKGCADLLAAMDLLPDSLRSTPLVIVGDGPLRPALERQAREAHLRAQFVGAEPPPAVRDRLGAASVFCVPSRRAADGDAEGFGMVFLEAAAAGLPVVAYRSGGVPEAVQDGVTGILCAEGDVSELARALATVLTDKVAAEHMGRAGRARVRQRFDIRQCTAALESDYDRVLMREPRSRRAADHQGE